MALLQILLLRHDQVSILISNDKKYYDVLESGNIII